jgi:hypothetical protein
LLLNLFLTSKHNSGQRDRGLLSNREVALAAVSVSTPWYVDSWVMLEL